MQIKQDIMIETVQRALAEDIGTGDVTAALLSHRCVTAHIISRVPLFMCGQPWVNASFKAIDPNIAIEWLVKEGTWIDKPTTLCSIHGLASNILTAERTALNFLQTLSGTATQAYQFVEKLKGYSTRLLDTRKTIPGLRQAQKYAVRCAGGYNHRFGLYDAYLIKENHIKACGSIKEAVKRARAKNDGLLIEVEVETLDELREALEAKPDRILLDNFTRQMLVEAVAINKPGQCELEASGGINLENVVAIAETGVDYISIGAMTKSVQAIDLSLLLNEDDE